MRIFLVIHKSTNSAIPSNSIWYKNLYETLIDMGHTVCLYITEPIGSNNKMQYKAFKSNEILELFTRENKKEPFQLFFSYLTDDMVIPEVIDEIKCSGVITCNFSCNNMHQFYLVEGISPYFDFCLHSERDAREKFLKVGANPIWFQMAANPKYFFPQKLKKEIPISFVGMNYAKRARYIGYLLENNCVVEVFGPGWFFSKKDRFKRWLRRDLDLFLSLINSNLNYQAKYSNYAAEIDYYRVLYSKHESHFHMPISDEEMVNLYSKSNISLGFIDVFLNHDPTQIPTFHLHLREFEAPMCGALYLTGFCDEILEFYEPDKEILLYKNEYELLDKTKYFLKHDSEANKIRQSGRKRALNCHTYAHRFKQLFNQLGLVD
jgi:spore maturation protein CgeB